MFEADSDHGLSQQLYDMYRDVVVSYTSVLCLVYIHSGSGSRTNS